MTKTMILGLLLLSACDNARHMSIEEKAAFCRNFCGDRPVDTFSTSYDENVLCSCDREPRQKSTGDGGR